MLDFELIERKPTVDEFNELHVAVGWGELDRESVGKAIENTLYFICAVVDGKVIGMARVIGDGSICFYIQDVMVNPSFQRRGIGKAMMGRVMDYIKAHACKGAGVGLLSAKGKEAFYETFGFIQRPNDRFGCGMIQFWNGK